MKQTLDYIAQAQQNACEPAGNSKSLTAEVQDLYFTVQRINRLAKNIRGALFSHQPESECKQSEPQSIDDLLSLIHITAGETENTLDNVAFRLFGEHGC